MRRVAVTFAVAACWVLCLLTPAGAEASLPENGKIVFTSNRSSKIGHMENYDLYAIEPNGSNLTRLTKSATWESRPMWSPDGTQLTFSDDRGDVGMPVMSADGSNLRHIPTDPDVTGSLSFFPTWSADGTKLFFSSSDSPDAPSDIFTMDLDGSNQVNLTKTPKYHESYPDFSPDGSEMCVSLSGTGQPGQAATGIYLMNADGSDPTLLLEGGGECDWSPDGTKVAIGYTDGSGDTSDEGYGDSEVAVIDADGSGLTNLTSNSAVDVTPRWSPDGKKIVFQSDKEGDYDIYTMDADGSDVTRVTTDSGSQVTQVHDMGPDWQPLPGTTPPNVMPTAPMKPRSPRNRVRTT
jgi:Tol biopolymer transport system component